MLGQALQQRRARPGGADAAGAALDAQVLQHERLQVVRDLRQRLDRLRVQGIFGASPILQVWVRPLLGLSRNHDKASMETAVNQSLRFNASSAAAACRVCQ